MFLPFIGAVDFIPVNHIQLVANRGVAAWACALFDIVAHGRAVGADSNILFLDRLVVTVIVIHRDIHAQPVDTGRNQRTFLVTETRIFDFHYMLRQSGTWGR